MELSFSHIVKPRERNPNQSSGKVAGSRNALLRFHPPRSAHFGECHIVTLTWIKWKYQLCYEIKLICRKFANGECVRATRERSESRDVSCQIIQILLIQMVWIHIFYWFSNISQIVSSFFLFSARTVLKHGTMFSICARNDLWNPIRPFGTQNRHWEKKLCPKCYTGWKWSKK